jgi:hypothetical protein
MRDRNPIRSARRKINKAERERLGLATPPCALCIEMHHTAGRNHDPLLQAPLCEMHHREIHEQMLREGISLRTESDQVTRVEMAMRAQAVFMREEADAMDRWADLLAESRGKSR